MLKFVPLNISDISYLHQSHEQLLRMAAYPPTVPYPDQGQYPPQGQYAPPGQYNPAPQYGGYPPPDQYGQPQPQGYYPPPQEGYYGGQQPVMQQPGGQGYPPPYQGQGNMPPPPVALKPDNCPPGLEYLTQINHLIVKQKVELLEAFIGFETKNKYVVKNALGQPVYKVNKKCSVILKMNCFSV